METFNLVIEDFKRVERITDERIVEIEAFVEDQKLHNHFMRPFYSAE